MSTLDLVVRTLAVFIFCNRGWDDIAPLALAAIGIWTTLAVAYLALQPDPYPLFFGVAPRSAHWAAQSFPWKYLAGLLVLGFVGWGLFR